MIPAPCTWRPRWDGRWWRCSVPPTNVSPIPLGGHRVLTASVFCRPCMLRDCPIDHRCMKRVTVDAVYAAAAAALADTVDVA